MLTKMLSFRIENFKLFYRTFDTTLTAVMTIDNIAICCSILQGRLMSQFINFIHVYYLTILGSRTVKQIS
jgi:hypothetical protein